MIEPLSLSVASVALKTRVPALVLPSAEACVIRSMPLLTVEALPRTLVPDNVTVLFVTHVLRPPGPLNKPFTVTAALLPKAFGCRSARPAD